MEVVSGLPVSRMMMQSSSSPTLLGNWSEYRVNNFISFKTSFKCLWSKTSWVWTGSHFLFWMPLFHSQDFPVFAWKMSTSSTQTKKYNLLNEEPIITKGNPLPRTLTMVLAVENRNQRSWPHLSSVSSCATGTFGRFMMSQLWDFT